MKNAFPFSVFKRINRKYFYVQFKDPNTGKYSNQISTGQGDEKKAIQTAWDWYYKGIPQKNNKVLSLENKNLIEKIRKINLSTLEAEKIITELKNRGLIKSAIMTGSRQDIQLDTFLLDFWDYEKSPYIQEKLRKQHSIHRRYSKTSHMYIRLYWIKYFKGRVLGSLIRGDIENFINYLTEVNLSMSAKNHIIKAGMIALKWAYQRELIDRDLYSGITYFAGSKIERQILTPELAQVLFSFAWDSKHAELANKLSMVTGLRAGEILALRIQDLGNDCLYIRHSYNDIDGLKVTKNTESRIVELPFRDIMDDLITLAKETPHNEKMDGFIFWGLVEGRPIDIKVFRKYLRYGLVKIGMSETEANKITFHAWRHFFTTYMKDKLNDKLLQQQTGHKTHSMLAHYASHRIQSDKEKLQQAQKEVFTDILYPETGKNTKKILKKY